MMRKITFGVVVTLLSIAFTACSSGSADGGGSGGGPAIFDARGTIGGASDGVLAVIWVVSSGDDYAYSFGSATSSGTSFTVTFSSEPPAQALNSNGIGIGIVGRFPAGTPIAEGVLPEAQSDQLLGFTAQHAIIYKQPGGGAEMWWTGAFSDGFSCGACVAAPAGETFDGFEPADCTTLVLSDGNDGCNWT